MTYCLWLAKSVGKNRYSFFDVLVDAIDTKHCSTCIIFCSLGVCIWAPVRDTTRIWRGIMNLNLLILEMGYPQRI